VADKNTVEVSVTEFWEMYSSMVDYALGRQTGIVLSCVGLYRRHKAALGPALRQNLYRRIQGAIERVERLKTTLGWVEDHREWVAFAEEIRQEL
jgi:hypothetical protein